MAQLAAGKVAQVCCLAVHDVSHSLLHCHVLKSLQAPLTLIQCQQKSLHTLAGQQCGDAATPGPGVSGSRSAALARAPAVSQLIKRFAGWQTTQMQQQLPMAVIHGQGSSSEHTWCCIRLAVNMALPPGAAQASRILSPG